MFVDSQTEIALSRSDQQPVLADCNHMTAPVFVDGQLRTPSRCDQCIIEDASKPLTPEEAEDFARVTEQILKIAKRDSDEQTNGDS